MSAHTCRSTESIAQRNHANFQIRRQEDQSFFCCIFPSKIIEFYQYLKHTILVKQAGLASLPVVCSAADHRVAPLRDQRPARRGGGGPRQPGCCSGGGGGVVPKAHSHLGHHLRVAAGAAAGPPDRPGLPAPRRRQGTGCHATGASWDGNDSRCGLGRGALCSGCARGSVQTCAAAHATQLLRSGTAASCSPFAC